MNLRDIEEGQAYKLKPARRRAYALDETTIVVKQLKGKWVEDFYGRMFKSSDFQGLARGAR